MRTLLALVSLALSWAPLARAADPDDARTRTFQLEDGVALHGYDPVSYFAGGPRPGDPKRTATHRGVTYRFANDANRAAFLADPAKHEPAYGGWCAWAMLDGEQVDVDPKSFLIAEGRLLVFYKGLLGDTRAKWMARAKQDGGDAKLLAIADAKWRAIAGGDVAAAPAPAALPRDFRSSMEHLGSWFVPGGDAAGFHDVYATRGTIAAYRATGAFPAGTVLVKELRRSRAADYTTGRGVASATEDVVMWFVMEKSGGRLADGPLVGNGWAWGLYKPDAPERNVATDFRKDCLGCHAPAASSDWVYVQGYPALAAK